MSYPTFTFWLGVCVALCFLSCDAPRNNPLDPQNFNSPLADLEGNVQTIKVPRENIEGVRVRWEQGELLAVSNVQGNFRFEAILPHDGWLVFEKEGFHNDSFLVRWGDSKKVSVQQFLNATPALRSLDLHSEVVNRHPALKEIRILIRAGIADVDGDIDVVSWEIPGRQISGPLVDVGADSFASTFQPAEVGLQNEEIIGRDILIIVQDLFGNRMITARRQVERIIKEEVLPIFPIGGDTVSARPLLRWQKFDPGYQHTYQLEVFREVEFGNPELKWRQEHIASDSTGFRVATDLEIGRHFWVIWIVDEFRNRARSKPVTFEVR